MPRKIYVASSWRNQHQPDVVSALRGVGHEVYDFRNPPMKTGFGWHEIDPNWQQWTPSQYRENLNHPLAIAGHKSDMDAMEWADTCVLVLPSGRSASYEFGWSVGRGKRGVVYMPDACEPELMYRPAPIAICIEELLSLLLLSEPLKEILSWSIGAGLCQNGTACFQPAIEKSPFCFDHKCEAITCHNRRYRSFHYCEVHP